MDRGHLTDQSVRQTSIERARELDLVRRYIVGDPETRTKTPRSEVLAALESLASALADAERRLKEVEERLAHSERLHTQWFNEAHYLSGKLADAERQREEAREAADNWHAAFHAERKAWLAAEAALADTREALRWWLDRDKDAFGRGDEFVSLADPPLKEGEHSVAAVRSPSSSGEASEPCDQRWPDAGSGAPLDRCPRCFGKGLEGQDDRPGILIPENGADECRLCHGTGKVAVSPSGWRGVYPGMCIDPAVCEGYGHCPRERACSE